MSDSQVAIAGHEGDDVLSLTRAFLGKLSYLNKQYDIKIQPPNLKSVTREVY